MIRNKPHNNQLCAGLSRLISAYPVGSHFLRFAWQTTIAQEVDTIDGFTFVWFTDGKGWQSARRNLEETFDVLDTMYSISDMENGIIKRL